MTRIVNPQPEWMRALRPGDVLCAPRRGQRVGPLRVVRAVSHYDDGRLRCVEFAARRRTKFARPTVTYWYNDLIQQGWYAAGARIRLDSPLDRRLQRYIEGNEMPHNRPYKNRWSVTLEEAMTMP